MPTLSLTHACSFQTLARAGGVAGRTCHGWRIAGIHYCPRRHTNAICALSLTCNAISWRHNAVLHCRARLLYWLLHGTRSFAFSSYFPYYQFHNHPGAADGLPLPCCFAWRVAYRVYYHVLTVPCFSSSPTHTYLCLLLLLLLCSLQPHICGCGRARTFMCLLFVI